ncbi:hypothetical protein ONZ45_g10622 [Pleurotus djamor]|nr:hypothetical protein ONZ45_g10622 [Pleurotus djamor]
MLQYPVPSSQTGESRGHKRARSIGMESTEVIEGVIAVFRGFESSITAQSKFVDSVELQQFLFQAQFLRNALESLLKEREKAKNQYEVKSIPFSSVDESNLKEMGLEDIAVLTETAFHEFILSLQLGVITDEKAVEGVITFLSEQLFKVQNLIANKNEAAARMSINPFLMEIAGFLVRNGPSGVDRSSVAGWTELGIADQKRPVKVRHGRFMTILTGIVDYALGYGLKPVDPDLAQTIAMLEKTSSGRDTFILIEAKAIEARLWDCLRQVIAQSLALTNRQVTVAGARTPFASFALSDGSQWIFGVIKVNPDTNMERKDATEICVKSIECRCSPMLTMTGPADADKQTEIFKTLLTWVKIPSEVLWQRIKDSQVGGYVVEGEYQAKLGTDA